MTASARRGHRLGFFWFPPAGGKRGFSISELVVAISIMGVLAGIALVSYSQFMDAAKDVLAAERQEMMNQALHCFAQQNHEMVFASMENSTSDELVILRTLQFRDPDPARAKTGSPYIDPSYNPRASSSADKHRLRWAGKMFELLKPGQEGSGLLMDFEGADFTTAFSFPPNFQMAGR